MKLGKRGQVGLREIPASVLFLVLAGAVGVIGLVLMESVGDAAGEEHCEANTNGFTTYNATAKDCTNGSHFQDAGFGVNASTDSQEGVAEVYENFDLIGLMIGLGAVLVILLVVFGFIARRDGL